MSLKKWAEEEIKLACKNENPNWDGESFDYGCSCYQSALKAYNSLLEDGHSGYSFGLTKHILIRLMNGLPLQPITDDDFDESKLDIRESPEYLKEMGLKSNIQCYRMTSLFRKETLDGKVSYTDVNRVIGIDERGYSFSNGRLTKMIDEMYPITMPHYPSENHFKVYIVEFLCDKKNGDFDHYGYTYMITDKLERIELDMYFKEVNGEEVQISKEEFYEDMKKRID